VLPEQQQEYEDEEEKGGQVVLETIGQPIESEVEVNTIHPLNNDHRLGSLENYNGSPARPY